MIHSADRFDMSVDEKIKNVPVECEGNQIPTKSTIIEFLIIGCILSIMLGYSFWKMTYRVQNFLTGYPLDSAVAIQALCNTLQGHFMEQTLEARSFNILSYHGSFILLGFLPLMWLFPHGLTLCLVKNALVVMSAIPMYFLIRDVIDNRMNRFTIFLTYCISAFLLSFSVLEIHMSCFALPFLVACCLFWERQNLRGFLICAMMCLFSKENFAFLFIAWGILALFARQNTRWILYPIIISGLYLLVYGLLNKFYFTQNSFDKINLFKLYYGVWGTSLTSTAWGVISHPIMVVKYIFNSDKWFYLAYVTFPFLPFLFMKPRYLFLSMPCIGVAFMMSGRTTVLADGSLSEELYHPGMMAYYLEVCVFAFVACVQSLSELQDGSQKRWVLATWMLAGLCIMTGYAWSIDTFSTYLLTANGLKGHVERFIGAVVVGFLGVGLLGMIRMSALIKRRCFSLLMIALCLFHLIFVWSYNNMLCPERYMFQVSAKVKARNLMARGALQLVPLDKYLVVPAKYSIIAAPRTKLAIYNGTESLSDLRTVFYDKPEYVFVDLWHYSTVFDADYLAAQWNKSNVVAMVNNTKCWDILFAFDNLYLLHRK